MSRGKHIFNSILLENRPWNGHCHPNVQIQWPNTCVEVRFRAKFLDWRFFRYLSRKVSWTYFSFDSATAPDRDPRSKHKGGRLSWLCKIWRFVIGSCNGFKHIVTCCFAKLYDLGCYFWDRKGGTTKTYTNKCTVEHFCGCRGHKQSRNRHIVHYGYMASAKMTSVLREAMLSFSNQGVLVQDSSKGGAVETGCSDSHDFVY